METAPFLRGRGGDTFEACGRCRRSKLISKIDLQFQKWIVIYIYACFMLMVPVIIEAISILFRPLANDR